MVTTRTVKTALIEGIRKDIVRGIFTPGAHLRLDQLAERFNVSTMPIREALRALEAEGIVQSIPNRGAFVRRFTSTELLDIYEMRAVLERLATRYAVPNLKYSHLQELQDMLDGWRADSDDIAIFVQQFANFHMAIYEVANRQHLSSQINILRNRTNHYLHNFVADVGRFEEIKHEHQYLLDTCIQKNAETASQLMFEHVLTVGKALAEYVQNSDDATL